MNTNNLFKNNTSYEIREAINPRKVWKSILYFSIIVLIAGLAYDYYMYRVVSRESLYVEVTGEELVIEKLEVNKIKSIISFFDTRVEKNASLKNKNLIDPAL